MRVIGQIVGLILCFCAVSLPARAPECFPCPSGTREIACVWISFLSCCIPICVPEDQETPEAPPLPTPSPSPTPIPEPPPEIPPLPPRPEPSPAPIPIVPLPPGDDPRHDPVKLQSFVHNARFNPSTRHLYYVIPQNFNWVMAEAYAQALGGHLVSINDRAEQEWLVRTFGGTQLMWIGLTDAAYEGWWSWTSGEPITFTNWYPGEPNDWKGCYSGGEDYVQMNYGGPGLWNDCSPCCSEWVNGAPAIVEIPRSTP